jgi:hypothetical protein
LRTQRQLEQILSGSEPSAMSLRGLGRTWCIFGKVEADCWEDNCTQGCCNLVYERGKNDQWGFVSHVDITIFHNLELLRNRCASD